MFAQSLRELENFLLDLEWVRYENSKDLILKYKAIIEPELNPLFIKKVERLFSFHFSWKMPYPTDLKLLLADIKNTFTTSSHVGSTPMLKINSFEDMFKKSGSASIAIEVLKKVTPPIISKDNEFVLGSRSKGAVTAWVSALRSKGYIHNGLKDKEIAPLLNVTLPKLNLGADGRTLRNTQTTAYKKYYTDILSLLP